MQVTTCLSSSVWMCSRRSRIRRGGPSSTSSHDRDGQTLFELCSRLIMKHGIGSSRQAISQHLDVLEAAGLVRTRREGRYKFHYLDLAPLNAAVERWSTPTEGGPE